MLHYLVEINDAKGHYFDVSLYLEMSAERLQSECSSKDAPQGLTLNLPTWIPGSYLIREFSRHIVSISGQVNHRPVLLEKQTKNSWWLVFSPETHTSGTLMFEVQWRVYAWDLSVRGAHLDENHAFFNGTSLFLVPTGFENEPIELRIRRNPCNDDFNQCAPSTWQVACGLQFKALQSNSLNNHPQTSNTFEAHSRPVCGMPQGLPFAPGNTLCFEAENYDALIDHPFEAGCLHMAHFEAHGIPHVLAIYNAYENTDLPRLCKDLKPVCEEAIALFEPDSLEAPFKQYWFIVHATDQGYGGLEHRNSTALLCARNDLPRLNQKKAPEGYDTFLGLCSHEYFHAWNIKRIKPAAFIPYRLNQENYTRLLWLFEGFTSYYDDLLLARVRFFDEETYLKRFAKTIAQVHKSPGHSLQTVADSSFEAWTKYYRQDENSPNTIVSYYTKGALVAFCLDGLIRERTQSTKSLDDVMRHLWNEYGKKGIGLREQDLPREILNATGLDLSSEIFSFTETTAPLPLTILFKSFGYNLEENLENDLVYLGIQGQSTPAGYKVKQVYNGSPAHLSGIAAGDLLVAANQWQWTDSTLKSLLSHCQPEEKINITGFRAERLFQTSVMLCEAQASEWTIRSLREDSLDKNDSDKKARKQTPSTLNLLVTPWKPKT